MARGRWYFALSVFLAGLLLTGCGDKANNELLESARTYLKNKEPKSATIQLKNVLQKDPSSAEARFLLATALLQTGDAAGAEIELKRAAELNYSENLVAPLMATVWLRSGQYEKLTNEYAGKTLSDADASVEVQIAVAKAFSAQDAPNKARDAIAKALAIAPQSIPALLAHAQIKAGAKDFDGALAVLDGILSKPPENAQAWQMKGDVLAFGKGDIDSAIAGYLKSLEIQPKNAELRASLISLYFVKQDKAAADAQYQALKASEPGHPLTKFYQAQIAFANNDFKTTHDLLQDLLRLVPENVSVLFISGATELALNSLEQAEANLSKAIKLQPQFLGARRLLAMTHLRQNQPGKALTILRPILGNPGVDAETLTVAGQASLLANDSAAADGFFARAAKLKPNDAKARTALAMSQLAKGKPDSAFTELQSIAAADPGVSADMALISARLRRNELDAALKAIDGLEKKQPKSPIANDLRGRVAIMRKDASGARKSFDKALSLDAGYFPATASLASLDMLDKKPDAARKRFEDFLKTDPKNVQALLALAELKRLSGGTREEIAKLLNDAINADPTDTQARTALIEHHAAVGDFKVAVIAAQAATAAIPNNLELQDKLARMLWSDGDTNRAKNTFSKMATLNADSPLGHLGLAEMNIDGKDFAQAAKNAKQALDLAPDSLAAQRAYIIVAMRQNRPQDASRVARSMQTQRPRDSLGFILEGDIEIQQARWDLAMSALRKAITKPNPAQAPGRLHFAMARAKKSAEAAKFADAWITEHPRDTLFMLYMADTALAASDSTSAEKYYQLVLKQQPENAMALNNLAYLMIQQKKPGAVALAERAVKAAPMGLAYADTLALALAGENQQARAIEMQKKLIAQAPQALAFRLTLAKIYLQAGEKSLARNELEELLKLGKDFPGRDEAAQLVKTAAAS